MSRLYPESRHASRHPLTSPWGHSPTFVTVAALTDKNRRLARGPWLRLFELVGQCQQSRLGALAGRKLASDGHRHGRRAADVVQGRIGRIVGENRVELLK